MCFAFQFAIWNGTFSFNFPWNSWFLLFDFIITVQIVVYHYWASINFYYSYTFFKSSDGLTLAVITTNGLTERVKVRSSKLLSQCNHALTLIPLEQLHYGKQQVLFLSLSINMLIWTTNNAMIYDLRIFSL